MDEGTIALAIASVLVFLVFAGLFIWGLIKGQFRDIEEPKFRMLDKENSSGKKRVKEERDG